MKEELSMHISYFKTEMLIIIISFLMMRTFYNSPVMHLLPVQAMPYLFELILIHFK
jgi:hypothetical protein